MLLCIPFGASSGYATVTLAYQLSQSGVGVAARAALVAMNVFPQTYKVLWAPIVDTTLSSKQWYLISALVTAATIGAIGFIHPDAKGVVALTALVFANSAAVSFLAMGAENLMANATRAEEKGRAGARLVGAHERQPVGPNRLIDLGGAPPGLTGERDDERRRAGRFALIDELP